MNYTEITRVLAAAILVGDDYTIEEALEVADELIGLTIAKANVDSNS